MKASVCVIIRHNNLYLGVSRKDNHNDFGLIGGKVDSTDTSLEFAIRREAKEEANIDLINLQYLDTRLYGGYNASLFVADIDPDSTLFSDIECISRNEGIIRWCTYDQIITGSFGDYNRDVIEQFNLN